MKHKLLTLAFLLIGTLLLWVSNSLFAGGDIAGNGGLFLPKNENGEVIQIEFSAKHPYHNELFTYLKQADMPRSLKEEMIQDLNSTSIIYSDEIVKYEDLKKQVQLYMKDLVERTVTDPDGKVTQTKEVHWETKEIENHLGIVIDPINLKVDNLDQTYVAAYTTHSPKMVLYFRNFSNQMSQDEALTLVLHEQAHRLISLNSIRNDERQIEAWSRAMLHYLKNEMPKEEFYQILKTNGISTAEQQGFDRESCYEDNRCYSSIQVLISKEDINLSASSSRYQRDGRQHHFIQVKNTVFHDFPLLSEMNYQTIWMLISRSPYEQFHAQDFINELFNSNSPVLVRLIVRYQKTLERDPVGRIFYHYSDFTLEYEPDLIAFYQFKNHLDELLKDQPLIKTIFIGNIFGCNNPAVEPYYVMEENLRLETLDIASKVNLALTNLKHENPDFYEFLMTYFQFHINFDISATNAYHLEKIVPYGNIHRNANHNALTPVNFVIEVPFSNDKRPSLDDIATLFSFDEPTIIGFFNQWQLNKIQLEFNKTKTEIVNHLEEQYGYSLVIEDQGDGSCFFNGKTFSPSSEDTKKLLNFFKTQDLLNQRLKSVASKLKEHIDMSRFIIHVGYYYGSLPYNIAWRFGNSEHLNTTGTGSLDLYLALPAVAMRQEEQWNAFSQALMDKILSPKVLIKKDPCWFQCSAREIFPQYYYRGIWHANTLSVGDLHDDSWNFSNNNEKDNQFWYKIYEKALTNSCKD